MPSMHVHPHSGAILFQRTPQEQEERRLRQEAIQQMEEVKGMKEELASKLKEVDVILAKLKGK